MGLFNIFLIIFTFLTIAGFITHLWSDGDIIGLVTIIIAIFTMVMIIISKSKLNNIQNNTKYIVEEQQHKIKEINEKQVILDDGKKYKYKFEYDEKAESPYAKIADCQYSKAAKSWFGESLTDQIVIIYTCIIVNNCE